MTDSQFMASHKGATGPVSDTAEGAARGFFGRYDKPRACTVRAVRVVSGDLVVTDFKTPSRDFTRKELRPD